MTALLLDGSLWFLLAAGVAVSAGAVAARRRRSRAWEASALPALHLIYGCMVIVMAIGHVVAVSIKLSSNSLQTDTPPFLLYGVAVAFAAPAVWLVLGAWPNAPQWSSTR